MRAVLLIPARNEAASLPRVVRELQERRPGCPILVVDDASEDETASILPALGVHWLRLPVHIGLGGAVRGGLRYARQLGAEVVVRVDGDGQHAASDIPRLLEPLQRGWADAVQGSRYLDAGGDPTHGLRRRGRRALAFLLTRLCGQPVTDPTSGLWAFGPRAVALLAEHHPSGYPEPELRLFLARNGLRVTEVAVQMRARLGGKSSLTAGRAGLAGARVLLALVVVPLRAAVGRPRP
jgi:hypothetical protein